MGYRASPVSVGQPAYDWHRYNCKRVRYDSVQVRGQSAEAELVDECGQQESERGDSALAPRTLSDVRYILGSLSPIMI